MSFSIGDILFFVVDGVAGESMFIGHLKREPGALVMMIGGHPVESDASTCLPTRRSLPAEGASWRRKYLKANPGALAG